MCNWIRRAFGLVLSASVLLSIPTTGIAAAKQIGQTVFVRGAATAQPRSGNTRILGNNAPIYEGEVLRTTRRSYAVLKFTDGTRTTLRPNSVFRVDEYIEDNTPAASGIVSKARAVLSLFKGGLRMLTGLISKRNRQGFRLATPVATIGIRGTEFEARLCDETCQAEAARVAPRRDRVSRVVARVAFTGGSLSAVDRSQTRRDVPLGGALFEGDVLETGDAAIAVLEFKDESRVTLQANSRLHLARFTFDPERPADGAARLRFIAGAVRVATGQIAQVSPDAYSVETPSGTIKADGASFDLRCLGRCKAGDGSAAAPGWPLPVAALLDALLPPARAQPGDGLATWVWNGSIVFQVGDSTYTFSEGSVTIANGTAAPVTLPNVPVFFQSATHPANDPSIDASDLFTAVNQDTPQPGLYVQVISGDVAVTPDGGGAPQLAGSGEAVFRALAGGSAVRLTVAPRLLPTPDPGIDYTPLEFTPGGESTGQFECSVQ